MKEVKFKNGEKVIDTITSFDGVITAICVYLSGDIQYLVTSRATATNEVNEFWFSENRLRLV